MTKVTFTSVELLKYGATKEKKTARFEFSLTKTAIADMGWGEIPSFQSSADLDGDLAASLIQLRPNDEALKRHAIDLEVKQVHNFVATKQELEGKRGKGTRWTVQCDVLLTEMTAMKKLEAYMATCGKSEMRISYEPAAVQVNLPGTEPTSDQEALPGVQ